LLDLEAAFGEVDSAWEDLAQERIGLLAATAVSSECVRHVQELAASLALTHPALSTLERVVSAAYLMEAIEFVQRAYAAPIEVALELVADTAFGDPHETQATWFGGGHRGAPTMRLLHEFIVLTDPSKMDRAWQRVVHLLGRRLCRDETDRMIKMIVDSLARRFLRVETMRNFEARVSDEDFLSGDSGLLFTSQFARLMSASRMIEPPRAWSAPRQGFFGPQWDESEHAVTSTLQLMDYLGGVIPALVWAAQSSNAAPHKRTGSNCLPISGSSS
jgi:hypothetical protein